MFVWYDVIVKCLNPQGQRVEDRTKWNRPLLKIQPTCNYHLPQTSVVLLYTEQSSDIFGHEATWGYLGKMW